MSTEHEITLAEAAAYLPRRNGKRVHVRTIKRWIINGCRGVRLNGWKRGGIWFTSIQGLEQFRMDCSRKSTPALVRSPAAVSRAVAEAREQLRRKGFYGRDAKALQDKAVPSL